MRFSKTFKRILCAVLCLCMIFGASVAMVSCMGNLPADTTTNNGTTVGTDNTTDTTVGSDNTTVGSDNTTDTTVGSDNTTDTTVGSDNTTDTTVGSDNTTDTTVGSDNTTDTTVGSDNTTDTTIGTDNTTDTTVGTQDTNGDTDNSNKVTVVRAIKYMAMGTKIERANFEEVLIDKDLVPEGAYSTISEVVNKFLKTDVYPGDYLFEEKVSRTIQFMKGDSDGNLHEDYVIVTQYTSKVTNGDVSSAIQQAIDENPNRTIYFPDGTYPIHKPIMTSADPAKAVSIRLSNYAIITAAGTPSNWPAGTAMIQLGAKDTNGSLDTKTYFIGGYVNAASNGKAEAISVVAGTVLINNVSIKGAEVGITIGADARADVDSCVIIGNNELTAIGVLMQGEESTLTNMRMCHMTIGVKLEGANNVLRNIHPLYVNKDNRWSTGFYDTSSGNFYDVCYSDQYAISFYMGENTKSIYNGCFGFWYAGNKDGVRKDKNGSALPGQQYGFYAVNAFNSIIRDTRITLNENYKTACDLTFLRVEKGAVMDRVEDAEGVTREVSYEGNGVVLYPRGAWGDEHYNDWFNTFCKTDRLG